MEHGPIEIEPYDPGWRERFERERERIREAYPGDPLLIAHVGSTAVPGLAAKPIVDVLMVVGDVAAFVANREPLVEQLGYDPQHELDDWHALFGVDETGGRVNLHVKPVDGDQYRWEDNLLLREYLRDHPESAAEYERLKRELADEHPEDVEAYSRGKSAFVTEVLERAREAGYEDRLPDPAAGIASQE